MRTAAPREGQDHDTLLPNAAALATTLVLAALTAALPSQPAKAQAAPPCTAIENDAERLACYDRALRAPSAASPAPAARTAPAASSPAPSSAPAASAAEPSRQRQIRESTAPAAPAAPVAGGSDDDDDDGIIPIVIIGVHAPPGRETRFTTEDGTTWVQSDNMRVANLPDTPFTAELKPGTLGSYFLVPKEGRAIRVRNAGR